MYAMVDYQYSSTASHVESARTSPGTFHWYNGLFVFGDSFADTGNFPKSNLSEVTREWYKPYGISHGFLRDPTGRFSDGLVQSDFIAKILGRSKAPQTYRSTKDNSADQFGVNFAVGGAGVFEVPRKAPTLAEQIDSFKEMLDGRTIGKWQLKESVALVAISGNDYARVANMSSDGEILDFIGNVTDGMAKGVERLLELGVTKVLVNALPPLGCTPWQARPSNYTKCKEHVNMAADFHNNDLGKKLKNATKSDDSVYLLDLNWAFNTIVDPLDPHDIPQVAKQFKNKLKPCCDSFDPNGYCGQVDEDGGAQYSVCSDPEKHFFWDDVHPTQAGWEAIMEQLEQDIKDFLHISY
ncbi:GDSL esterase/lipase [Dichanthelium oligosanthes]|uniref:GDSL esterase/lipase n=1 Tax=Dichanthelium oligosanthes TaxID=888268 RepID=A0A1E5VSE9_9POAL|nr:GDSL esterase/lipase [Dichanthelium oligosanthes]